MMLIRITTVDRKLGSKSFKGPKKIEISLQQSKYVHTLEILDYFHIPSIENWSSDDEVIFQDDNTCFTEHRESNLFFRKKYVKINVMAIEQFRSKFNGKFKVKIL